MAEEGTLAINGDVEKKAGAKASTVSKAEAYTNVYIKEGEGVVSGIAKYDFVTNYASLSAIGKEWLRDAVAAYAALQVINYNMATYTSRTEAKTMMNVNLTSFNEAKQKLKDKEFVKFIQGGA